MLPMNLSKPTIVFLMTFLLLASGCPAPAEQFEEFVDRTEEQRLDGEGGVLVGGVNVDITGTFLLGLSAGFLPDQPLQFLVAGGGPSRQRPGGVSWAGGRVFGGDALLTASRRVTIKKYLLSCAFANPSPWARIKGGWVKRRRTIRRCTGVLCSTD